MLWVVGLVVSFGLLVASVASGYPALALVFLVGTALAAGQLLRRLALPVLRRAQQEQESRAVEAARRKRPVEVQVVPLGAATYQVMVNGERLWVGSDLAKALEQANTLYRRLRGRGFVVSPVFGPWPAPSFQRGHQHDHGRHQRR